MALTSVPLLRREPYGGSYLSIVIGIDVGTTYSGVSYAILRPGEVPEVISVSRLSGQDTKSSKIPSVIIYDKNLRIRAIGLETMLDSVSVEAEMENWLKAEYFKLHLSPLGLQGQTDGLKIGSIPEGKTAEEVMGDYLRYLYNGTAAFIKLSHSDGEQLWDQVKDRVTFVLGHPNGWKGASQQRYRRSVVLAGLISDTVEDHKRVRFVSEGEASALACLSGGLGPTSLQPGYRFVIADAGGGTVDVSTFEVTRSLPVELKECAPPDGCSAGSVFVNYAAERFLKERLRNTKYDDELRMKDIIQNFESKTKREFKGDDGLLKVGSRREKDESLGIKLGFLALSSDVLRSFFDHSVSGLADAVLHQLSVSKSNRQNTPVWLVGGFGSSQYLLQALQSTLGADGVIVQSPDTNLAKAVANGAVLHFIDNSITSRVCDSNYGTTAIIPFNPLLAEHRNHLDLITNDPEGLFIGPIFSCIAQKGTPVGIHQTATKSYYREITTKGSARNFSTELLCYDGDPPLPKRYKESENKFRKVCTLQADLSELCCESTLVKTTVSLGPLRFETTTRSWQVNFDIELKFGTTELEAAIKWQVNGNTKRGPVKIIHNSENFKQ